MRDRVTPELALAVLRRDGGCVAVTLGESPEPDEPEPLDTGPCPHGYATRRPCPQCGVALAASATDEPDPAECAICGDYVAGGQPVHNICVAELTAKAEDRPAAPVALDVERLGDALARVFPVSFRGEAATEPLKSRALLMDYAHRIAREYAALRSEEPTDA